jgi:hypothetical protein
MSANDAISQIFARFDTAIDLSQNERALLIAKMQGIVNGLEVKWGQDTARDIEVKMTVIKTFDDLLTRQSTEVKQMAEMYLKRKDSETQAAVSESATDLLKQITTDILQKVGGGTGAPKQDPADVDAALKARAATACPAIKETELTKMSGDAPKALPGMNADAKALEEASR